MVVNQPKRLLVVIPITRTGYEPFRAISSLNSIAQDCIILASFNRPIEAQKDDELLSLLKNIGSVILQTPKKLTGPKHFDFILSYSSKVLKISSGFPTTLLCDDDELLISKNLLPEIAAAIKRNTAFWGDYIVNDTIKGKIFQANAFYSSQNRSLSTRIERLIDEMTFALLNCQTPSEIQGSITGIIAPFSAYLSACRYYKLTRGLHGARMELLILSWRNLKVQRFERPIARIYLHQTQAGRQLAGINYSRDELRFRIYALLQCSSFKEIRLLSRSGYNLNFIFKSLYNEIKVYLRKNLSMPFKSISK